ncbi:MAG: helix-turn-helix transcriptional regulator [Butyrivibrio sp.]|nr:helix-turn-helix transcriptional regulator [Butyrivibrio sp.]
MKNLRKKAGLTQEELAFELNLESKSTISSYENDKREASHDILVELASKLNTTVDYILSGDSMDDSDIEILISAFKGIKSQKLREAAIKQIQILAAFEKS